MGKFFPPKNCGKTATRMQIRVLNNNFWCMSLEFQNTKHSFTSTEACGKTTHLRCQVGRRKTSTLRLLKLKKQEGCNNRFHTPLLPHEQQAANSQPARPVSFPAAKRVSRHSWNPVFERKPGPNHRVSNLHQRMLLLLCCPSVWASSALPWLHFTKATLEHQSSTQVSH